MPYDHGAPIGTLSLAPLAGVLLALALVFAALRPPVIHALLVDFPVPTPFPERHGRYSEPNRLWISAEGAVTWNGTAATDRQLRLLLSGVAAASPQPALLFGADGHAPYPRTLAVLEIVREEGLVDRCFRFSGIDRFRAYERSAPGGPVLRDTWGGCTYPQIE